MSLSIEDILVQCGENYKLNLVAGHEGCTGLVEWVHLVEDFKVIQFLWPNDLAMTLGMGFQEEDDLLNCIKKLASRHCSGLIINTGKYVNEIPQHIIDYCNENQFPLILMPWEIHVTTVIRDISVRCMYAQKEDQLVGQRLIEAFKDPDVIDAYRNDFMTSFDVEGKFQVLMIQVENTEDMTPIQLQRLASRIRYYFDRIDAMYQMFWYNTYLVLVVNNMPEDELHEITKRMYRKAMVKLENNPLHIGIGTQVKDIRNIITSAKRAKAALKYGLIFEKDIYAFKDMKQYQILFMVEDTLLLDEFYHEKLKNILEYDLKHNTELEKTLYYYIKHNGSIQKIAESLFAHRNTINYRIAKIKEILDSDLTQQEELFQYSLAFYIKKMRK
ncbi:MAG: PucR family transcriptional regulator ligand-binding domain-containing protein [Holdemanella sp.]|nr:PucR family transcriptional regulator ligand-binding domain-containing protein [Holdemanella sp.]